MNSYSKELMHHGVQGMRWGIRRYQPYGVGYDPQKVGKFIGNMKRTPRGIKKLSIDFPKMLNTIKPSVKNTIRNKKSIQDNLMNISSECRNQIVLMLKRNLKRSL